MGVWKCYLLFGWCAVVVVVVMARVEVKMGDAGKRMECTSIPLFAHLFSTPLHACHVCLSQPLSFSVSLIPRPQYQHREKK